MKKLLLAFGILCAPLPAFSDQEALQKSISGKHRSEANIARDRYRHPMKTIQFFGIEPEHTVVEVWPGGGWYTEILAPYLKKKGKLIAAHYDTKDNQAEYRPSSRKNFETMLKNNPKIFGDVEVTSLMFDESAGTLSIAAAKSNSVDRVVTFRSAHGMYHTGVLDAALTHFYDILKPGGKLGFVQHQADPHQDWMSQNIGYIGKDHVISVAAKAGFELEAEAYFNNNPKDHKRYDIGVWQIPPSLRGLKSDAEKAPYLAIGESDRMTLLFVKPK